MIKALGVPLTRVQARSDDPQVTVPTVIAAGNAIYDGPRLAGDTSTARVNGRAQQSRADSLGTWGQGKRLIWLS